MPQLSQTSFLPEYNTVAVDTEISQEYLMNRRIIFDHLVTFLGRVFFVRIFRRSCYICWNTWRSVFKSLRISVFLLRDINIFIYLLFITRSKTILVHLSAFLYFRALCRRHLGNVFLKQPQCTDTQTPSFCFSSCNN